MYSGAQHMTTTHVTQQFCLERRVCIILLKEPFDFSLSLLANWQILNTKVACHLATTPLKAIRFYSGAQKRHTVLKNFKLVSFTIGRYQLALTLQ